MMKSQTYISAQQELHKMSHRWFSVPNWSYLLLSHLHHLEDESLDNRSWGFNRSDMIDSCVIFQFKAQCVWCCPQIPIKFDALFSLSRLQLGKHPQTHVTSNKIIKTSDLIKQPPLMSCDLCSLMPVVVHVGSKELQMHHCGLSSIYVFLDILL